MNTKEAKKLLEGRGYKVYEGGKPEDCDRFDSLLELSKRQRKRLAPKEKQRQRELRAAKLLFKVWQGEYFMGIYTGRELVIFAKHEKWCYDFPSLKDSHKRKGRTKTRDSIKKQDYDKL